MRRLPSRAARLAVVAGLLVAAGAGSHAGGAPGALPPPGSVLFESSAGIQVASMDGRALRRLTRDEYDADPVWSPDAKRIAFARLDVGVLVMNADGSGVRRIGHGSNPFWSPDGTRIAFDANGGGISVVHADGTGTKRFAVRSRFGFTWSPDGKRIAYSDREESSRIHILEVASGASTTLGASSFNRAGSLAWSPDGMTIAFDADKLHLIDVATGRVTELTDGFAPVWSPDGARIAFLSRGSLFTIGRDGGGRRRLAVGAAPAPASWSSDGGFLAYERQRFAGCDEYCRDVWRVAADGSGVPHAITRAFPTGDSYSAPRWAARTTAARPSKTEPTVALRPSRILRTPTMAEDLAADGGVAAVATGGAWGCGPVALSTRHGRYRWLPGSSGCGDGDATYGIVLAGRRAAWMYDQETLSTYLTALVTGTPRSGARELTSVSHYGGTFLGNLVGDRSLLVYNTWKEVGRAGAVKQKKLWRIAGARRARKRLLLAGPNAADVVAVDAGRIAVLRRDGRLAILNEHGKRLSAFRLGWKNVYAVRLTGSQVVVLRGATVEVRDARRGTLKHRWPAAKSSAGISLEDAQGNFAVYTSGIAIHLLRLSDGRDRLLAIPKQAGPANAELEPDGLHYSYNETWSAKPGRVAFVPFRRLTARFR
jgi:dipeptidyl aminopeptidase/acylaminoacyl peptidase